MMVVVPIISAVVALTRQGGLGNEGRLPWHPRRLQLDMAFLRHVTTHAVRTLDGGRGIEVTIHIVIHLLINDKIDFSLSKQMSNQPSLWEGRLGNHCHPSLGHSTNDSIWSFHKTQMNQCGIDFLKRKFMRFPF